MDMHKLIIPFDAGEVSDGHHTFNELYEHRCLLFIALMQAHPGISWRANNHSDGTMFDGWFVAGMHLSSGDITYHLKVRMWKLLDGHGIKTTNKAPEWDGHDSHEVRNRLIAWIKGE